MNAFHKKEENKKSTNTKKQGKNDSKQLPWKK